jgi:hypothetical protein
MASTGQASGQDCDVVLNQAPIRSLLDWSVVQNGHPGIESTDHVEGIVPVQLWVRLDPRLPRKIIAVQLKDQILDPLEGRQKCQEKVIVRSRS